MVNTGTATPYLHDARPRHLRVPSGERPGRRPSRILRPAHLDMVTGAFGEPDHQKIGADERRRFPQRSGEMIAWLLTRGKAGQAAKRRVQVVRQQIPPSVLNGASRP
jgi:hypothetical protein